MARLRANPEVMEAARIFQRCFDLAGLSMTPEIERQIEMACKLLYSSSVDDSRSYPQGYRPINRPTSRRD